MSASPPARSARGGTRISIYQFQYTPNLDFFRLRRWFMVFSIPSKFQCLHFLLRTFQYTLQKISVYPISVYPQNHFSIPPRFQYTAKPFQYTLPNHFSIPHFSIPCQIISVSPQDFIPRNHFSIPSKRFQYNLRNHFRRVYWNLGRYTEIISQGILKSWKVYWNDLAGYTEIGRYTRNYFAEIYS